MQFATANSKSQQEGAFVILRLLQVTPTATQGSQKTPTGFLVGKGGDREEAVLHENKVVNVRLSLPLTKKD